MSGGKPWGMRMQGGKGTGLHLKVGAVTPGSKSEAAGVVEGLHILTINGMSTADLTMTQAQDIVKQTGDTLKMQLIEKAECPADEEEDFLEDLKKSMGTTNNNINNNNNRNINTAGVKGNTFKMLQGHM